MVAAPIFRVVAVSLLCLSLRSTLTFVAGQGTLMCNCTEASACTEAMLAMHQDSGFGSSSNSFNSRLNMEDLTSEAQMATWVLSCMDDLNVGQCGGTCKTAVENQFGVNGACACDYPEVFDSMSRQSVTLVATDPVEILTACFGDKCTFKDV